MEFISAAVGQPYMNAVTSLADKAGDWIPIGNGLDMVCFDYEFALGGGNVTGVIYVEHSAQINGTPTTGTRLVLPVGCLHTSLSQATLASAPSPSVAVTLTAVVTGKLGIHLGQIAPGQIRSVYDFASGTGASPNQVTCYVTGRRSSR